MFQPLRSKQITGVVSASNSLSFEIPIIERQVQIDMRLPSIDDNWWDDSGLPEAITADEPTCPRCGLVHGMLESLEEYHRIDCDCGYRFEVEKKQVFISRPVEFTK